MNDAEAYLKRLGLSYDKLTLEEKEHYHKMEDALRKSVLTVDTLRDHIAAMREAVSLALIDEPEFNYLLIFRVPNRKQILLKARLQNYLLLESFLQTPEKVRKAMERQFGK